MSTGQEVFARFMLEVYRDRLLQGEIFFWHGVRLDPRLVTTAGPGVQSGGEEMDAADDAEEHLPSGRTPDRFAADLCIAVAIVAYEKRLAARVFPLMASIRALLEQPSDVVPLAVAIEAMVKEAVGRGDDAV